jgi:hypothetical protein
MRHLRATSLRRFWVVVTIIPVWIAGAGTPTRASSACDGHWRVAFYIDAGKRTAKCNRQETNHAVDVKDGNFSESNSGHDLRGMIKGCGSISFIVTRPGEKARGNGTVTGKDDQGRLKATGTWKVEQPSDRDCTGTWLAVQH